jgi:hypothetical protein
MPYRQDRLDRHRFVFSELLLLLVLGRPKYLFGGELSAGDCFILSWSGPFMLLRHHRRWPIGFYTGLLLLLYGVYRFLVDRENIRKVDYFSWSPDQCGAVLAAIRRPMHTDHDN